MKKNNSKIALVILIALLIICSYIAGLKSTNFFTKNTYRFFSNEINKGQSFLGFDIYLPTNSNLSWYSPEPNPGDESILSNFYIIDTTINNSNKQTVLQGEFYNATIRNQAITETEQAIPSNSKLTTLGYTDNGRVSKQAYVVNSDDYSDYYFPTFSRIDGISILKITVNNSFNNQYNDVIQKILLSISVY